MHIWMKLGYILSRNSYSEFQLSKMASGLRTYTYNMIIEHSVFAMKSTTPLRQVHAPLPCSCNLAHSSLRLTQCPCNSASYLLTQLSISSRNLLAAVFDTTVNQNIYFGTAKVNIHQWSFDLYLIRYTFNNEIEVYELYNNFLSGSNYIKLKLTTRNISSNIIMCGSFDVE